MALRDLRSVLEKGLPYALNRWLSPSDPHFEGLVQESIQETLLKALDHLQDFKGRSRFTTWVQKIAVREALAELRRARWKDVSLDDLVDPEEGGAPFQPQAAGGRDPEMSAEQADTLERLNRILAEELTDKQRRALLAVGVHGMPTEEVARRMGTNRNALYKLLHDARLRLKERLSTEGLSAESVLATFEG